MTRATNYIFLLTILIGCNYIPCSSSSDLSNVKESPKKSAVVGIYKPDKFTMQDFTEYLNAANTSLTLSNDGSMTLKNFPKKTFAFDDVADSLKIDGDGTWSMVSQAGKTKISTNIRFSKSGVIQPSPFDLFKRDGKYFILIDIGDPDLCSSVRLEQQ